MWIDHLSYFLAGIMLMLTVMGMVLAGTMPGIERWNRRFFLFLFTALTLLITITTIDLIIYRSPGIPRVKAVVWYLESVLNSFPMFFFPFFLLHCCGERWQASRLIHANLLLWITYFVLLGVNQFTHLFYYAAQDGMFSRGPWYPLAIAPMDVMMLLNLAGVIRRRRLISGKYFRIFLIYLVPLSASMVVHTFLYIPMFFYVGLVISTFSMFAIILMDQVDQYLRQSQEIAAQRARITVLQMRPHFIFNTMMALYSLCGISPEKAQKVMLNFTTYLRKNFSAIASDHTIPFSEEIAHARAYLAVEEAMYEDSLLVEFDTPHTHFRVPPLILQPIVENAVKHGMDPDRPDPLQITVRTKETDSGWEIIVEDNGSGFRTPADDSPGSRASADDDPHIALDNIRQRLKMMCGGNITIMPRAEGGTVIQVTIPG